MRRLAEFDPLLLASIAMIFALPHAFAARAQHEIAWITGYGSLLVLAAVLCAARPIIRRGGYAAWLESSKVIDLGHFAPTPEEVEAERQDDLDALALQIVGPVLGLTGALIGGYGPLLLGKLV